MEKEEGILNFETGEILRNNQQIMTLEELLFLVGSAIQYNNMFPIQQSEKFVNELRETVGMGFTKEQYEEIKEMMKEMNEA